MDYKKIALMMSTLDSSASISIYKGIAETAYGLGYMTCVCLITPSKEISYSFYEREYHMFDVIAYDEYDAFIVAFDTINSPAIRERLSTFIQNTNKPVVAIDCDVEGALRVNTRNYRAQHEIVEHLIQVHHCKKINYISGPSENGEAVSRRRAYVDVMQQYGLYEESRIYEGSFYVEDGKRALQYFDSDPVACEYEAIVCGNDMGALSVYEELMKRGKRIPEDVIVTGFDDIEASILFSPALTTFSKNGRLVGETAVRMLHDYWGGKEVLQCITIDGEVSFRESCGCRMNPQQYVHRYNAQLSFFVEKELITMGAKACIQSCIAADSFAAYTTAICDFISMVKPEEFFFGIYENFMEDFHIRNGLIYQTSLHENEGKVIVPVAYCEGQFEDIIFRDREKRLSTDHGGRHFDQYLCSPIHFRDTDFGFIAFSGSPFPLMGHIYWEWRQGISNALSSLRDRLKLNDLYMRDSLTGLYNRFGLQHYWEILSKESQTYGYPLLFMFVDVDGLKKINDQYGHEAGDYTIVAIAQALDALHGRDIIAARYGGDEFIVLAMNMRQKEGALLQERFEKLLDSKNKESDMEFSVSASIGFFVKQPGDKMSFEDCIGRADKEMYCNKKRRYQS